MAMGESVYITQSDFIKLNEKILKKKSMGKKEGIKKYAWLSNSNM